MSDCVAIFRKRLLSYSETFIADQAKFLPRFEAVFCGMHRDPSGIDMLADSPRVLLDDYSRLPVLAKIALRSGLGINSRWMEALRDHDPDLIHAHFFNDGKDAVELGSRLQLPVVTTVHGHDITKYDNAIAQSRASRHFFERVDRVIAVSRYIARTALERGCPESKLVQHYIGIDLEKFTQQKAESEQPSLLFVGRLVEKKGCTYLLRAMEKLLPQFPEMELTIIGEGGLGRALQREVEERRLRVDFVGAASPAEIRRQLARSWLFVAPSITASDGDSEGLGMVFLEAQAMQTPVVSFRSGGVVEAVEDGVTGLLCEERDVEQLAENIAALLDNSGLRHNMGQQGRLRVTQHFDIRKQCASLERIYREVS